jgi:DNA-binding transcriptional regulator YiaG
MPGRRGRTLDDRNAQQVMLGRFVSTRRQYLDCLATCQAESPAIFAQAREALGMTQMEFAEAIGVTNVWVSNVETGHRKPSPELLAKLAELMGIGGD